VRLYLLPIQPQRKIQSSATIAAAIIEFMIASSRGMRSVAGATDWQELLPIMVAAAAEVVAAVGAVAVEDAAAEAVAAAEVELIRPPTATPGRGDFALLTTTRQFEKFMGRLTARARLAAGIAASTSTRRANTMRRWRRRRRETTSVSRRK
jgi:hypothetical protein